LTAGTTQRIAWSAITLENIKLDYTTDNGISWNTIAAGIPSVPSVYKVV